MKQIWVQPETITEHPISRSQAREVLLGLEKFNKIIFDFDKILEVGQAFADEIFRVFKNKYPDIQIQTEHMNQAVSFMVQRAQNTRR
jgi:hypothetical protein